MWTTQKLLKSLKQANDNCTNYRISRILECNPQTVANWEKKGTTMDEQLALKVASLLDLNEMQVLVDLQFERNKDTDSAPLWKQISQQFETVAAGVMVSAFVIAEAANLPIL